MDQKNKLIFMPNVGKDNFYPNTSELIDTMLSAQASADHPTVSSLNRTNFRHSSEGMVPINNKPKR
jgi:hypothetical protein